MTAAIHVTAKSGLRELLNKIWQELEPIIRHKKEVGWDFEMTRRFHTAGTRWLARQQDVGVPFGRQYLAELLDLFCLCADVEPHKFRQGWFVMLEELRGEGLVP